MKSTLAADELRRTAVMDRLVPLIKRGVDLHLQEIQSMIDRNPSSTAFASKWNHEMHLLRTNALGDTILMLGTYGTETLERVADVFSEPPTSKYGCLHMRLSYGRDEWNAVAGDNRDAMFRDYLGLSGRSYQQAESMVYTMLDVYRALSITPGSIHRIPPEELKRNVIPVFVIAASSRSVVRLRNKPGRRDAPPPVFEDYKGDHLRDEIVQYLSGFPERRKGLQDYMLKERKTLPEVDFDYFLERAGSHRSLAEGAL
jgi:hypothetical protein